MPQPRKPRVRVLEAQVKSLERALREERLAIAAIVKVMLIETPDPRRVLARLDAMCRAAEANPRTPAAVRRQLLDATLFVRTAIERETGRPQSLFDPHVGHVKPKDVDTLVEPTEGPQQLGLVGHEETTIGDVEKAHEDRVRTISAVHDVIVDLIRGAGAKTDEELYAAYLAWYVQSDGGHAQSRGAIKERRKELTAAGRLVRTSNGLEGPTWDVVEREALEAS